MIKKLIELKTMSTEVQVSYAERPLQSHFNSGVRLIARLRKGYADVELQFDTWEGHKSHMSVYFRNNSLLEPSELYDTAYITRVVVAISKAFEEL